MDNEIGISLFWFTEKDFDFVDNARFHACDCHMFIIVFHVRVGGPMPEFSSSGIFGY
jgi:hypothetical protein